ncbi:hypothetical protein Tco_1017238 [Tanacetum coccineum]|uniref:Uncharacterized protein n=1 Tax=Tanacetum coccineum TaxID=301880 RepID=A0ABQ5FQX3_9ASTR
MYNIQVGLSRVNTKLQSLWDEIGSVLPVPRCSCSGCTSGISKKISDLRDKERLYEFLMGLDNHFSVIRTQILAMNPILNLGNAYHRVAEDEHQRAISLDKRTTTEDAAFKTFVVDSGSTEHITHDASILENKSKSHFETPVVIPNGDAISVEGKGEEMDHFDAHENPAQYEALNSSGSHESDQQYYDANLGQESAPEGSNHDASSPISNEVDNMNHMAQEEPLDSSDQLGQPKRHRSQPKHLDDFVAFLAAIDSVDEPKKFHQAVKDERWKEAIRKEIRALEENGTWTL